MSNYPNMSYCMCNNTLLAMRQIIDAMREEGPQFLLEMHKDERRAFQELFNTCEDFMNLSEELQDEIEREGEYNDSMDGDHASALASAGWGTDEDYGSAGDDY
jgi:hypothetical protein